MKNLEIAKILYNLADILELQGIPWKPQAYRKAARSIETLTEDINDLYKREELEELPGVGKSIAEKITEFLRTGKIKAYEQLKKKVRINLEQLNEIPSLGPKKIKILYQKFRVKDVKDLEAAIKKGKLKNLAGFGEKTEQTLLEGIKFFKTKPKRFLYVQAVPIVEEIKEELSNLPAVKKMEIAGSFRRGKETVGDLDFLVVSKQPEIVMKRFTSLPDANKILAQGTTKSSIRLSNGLQVDLRIVKEKEFGSALLYFIGNKEHNIALRKIALKKSYTLSEYGLFKIKPKKWIAGKTEEEIYKKLKLQYIPPVLRGNKGELESAQKNKLPSLIREKDVQGIFHNHSNWSDGSNTLLEMAQKAEEMKLNFISFNDHFGHVGITNPLTEKRLTGYLKAIETVRKKVGIRIFSGVEIDILKDGKLPLPPKKLKELDVIAAAVHLATKMPTEKMTQRICYALNNYPINILAHPTDRLLNKRQPLDLNLDKIFACAKDNNVFLEVNGSPQRLDLSGENVRAALDFGCKIALSADAHSVEGVAHYKYGVLMAQRGWAETKDVLNCWSLKKIEKSLQK